MTELNKRIENVINKQVSMYAGMSEGISTYKGLLEQTLSPIIPNEIKRRILMQIFNYLLVYEDIMHDMKQMIYRIGFGRSKDLHTYISKIIDCLNTITCKISSIVYIIDGKEVSANQPEYITALFSAIDECIMHLSECIECINKEVEL